MYPHSIDPTYFFQILGRVAGKVSESYNSFSAETQNLCTSQFLFKEPLGMIIQKKYTSTLAIVITAEIMKMAASTVSIYTFVYGIHFSVFDLP